MFNDKQDTLAKAIAHDRAGLKGQQAISQEGNSAEK